MYRDVSTAILIAVYTAGYYYSFIDIIEVYGVVSAVASKTWRHGFDPPRFDCFIMTSSQTLDLPDRNGYLALSAWEVKGGNV